MFFFFQINKQVCFLCDGKFSTPYNLSRHVNELHFNRKVDNARGKWPKELRDKFDEEDKEGLFHCVREMYGEFEETLDNEEYLTEEEEIGF